jgi:ectoine hydroxylase-related dioxygenase (phytanoyl-CoA dioxygenase family)
MDQQSIKHFYDTNGFYIAENLIKQEQLDAYDDYWTNKVEAGLVSGGVDNHGFKMKTSRTSYLEQEEVINILCGKSVNDLFIDIDKAVALHMNLDYQSSTEKDWHQDTTLPQKIVGDNYTSVWIAMEDVHPDAGPLELVAGSHLWDLDFETMYPVNKSYTTKSATILLQAEMEKRNAEIVTFLPKRGDALVWHGRLIHRGSVPKNKDITRKSLIGHYCNQWANHTQTIEDAPDIYTTFKGMSISPNYAKHGDGGWYYVDPEGL